MSAAILFSPRAGELGRPLGIDVATDEFIRAFARYAQQDKLPVICAGGAEFGDFVDLVAAAGLDPTRCQLIDNADAEALAACATVIRYDPAISHQTWIRRTQGQKLYSAVGFTHAIASSAAMESIADYALAPTQPWDALICASHSIKAAVEALMENWQSYLKDRTGTAAPCPVQLPVIPLGVDVDRLRNLAGEEERRRQRTALDLDDDTVAVLYSGRLNHIAKANPLPLLLAAEEAARSTGKPIRVLFHGYYSDESIGPAFEEAAAAICEQAKISIIQNDDPLYPKGLWAAADIFCSPVDNLQESFGLTPVEAMAVGLPVIVSDWDGYRDTVRNGIEGFTLPSLMPAPGGGEDLAIHYLKYWGHYGDFVSAAAQSTAIDIGALTTALIQLIENPSLRQKMGAAGRARVDETFHWRHVIGAYEELFAELAQRRATEVEIGPPDGGRAAAPRIPDPFHMFAKFPTAHIEDQGELELADLDWAECLARIRLKIGMPNAQAILELEDLPGLMVTIETAPGIKVIDLIRTMDHVDGAIIRRTLAWLVKLGICRYRAD